MGLEVVVMISVQSTVLLLSINSLFIYQMKEERWLQVFIKLDTPRLLEHVYICFEP